MSWGISSWRHIVLEAFRLGAYRLGACRLGACRLGACRLTTPIGSIVMFRQDERGLGSMRNRFSIGMVTALSEGNLDGVSRSVYILANCRTEENPGEEAVTRHYIFHRRIEDVIILQDETTDQIEKIIAEEEAGTHEEVSEGFTDEEEEDEEEGEAQQALAVSLRNKTSLSPSFSLLLAMNQWEVVCAANDQNHQSESWPTLLLLAMFLVLLLLPKLTKSLGRAWPGALASAAMCISQVSCYQSLSPFAQDNVAAFVLKKMLKKMLHRLK